MRNSSPAPLYLRKARWSVSGYFTLSGFVFGTWAACIPSLDSRLNLGEARLGTVLFTLAVSTLIAILLSGPVCDRLSSRTVLRVAGPLCALFLIAPALAPSYPLLLVGAVIYGIGIGIIEVSMNANSVEVEMRYGRPIISAFHGLWSLGGAISGAATALALGIGVQSQAILVGTALLGAICFLLITKPLLAPVERPIDSNADDVAKRAIPLVILSAVALLSVAAHLAEGGVVDWANLHASRELDASDALAPLSYTIFGIAMTIVRLLGDPIRSRLGPRLTLFLSGAFAAGGYAIALGSTAIGSLPLSWVGWAAAGCGLGIVIPVLFSAIGQAGGGASSIALVSGFGSVGVLIGPILIGFTAAATSLTTALIIPAILGALIALMGPSTLRHLVKKNESSTQKTAVPAGV